MNLSNLFRANMPEGIPDIENNFDSRVKFRVRIYTKSVSVNDKSASFERARSLLIKVIKKNLNNLEFIESIKSVISDFGFRGVYRGDYDIEISAFIPIVSGVKSFICPRRTSSDTNKPLDSWDLRGDDLCCSYCGSIKPERVMELLKEGKANLSPTTKSYKFYVHREGVKNASLGGIKYYTQHNTKEMDKFLSNYINEKGTGTPGK